MDKETNQTHKNPQQAFYEDDSMDIENEEQYQEYEEEPVATFICDSCGYQNDIYATTCLACEKDLLDLQEEIQNEIACYICGALKAISAYEDHVTKCQFQRKIEILRGKYAFTQTLVRKEPKKKIKKSDTKKCMYCSNSYLLQFLHEHQKSCSSRPQPNKTFEMNPEVDLIEFVLADFVKASEMQRLTTVQQRALAYMHKKAIYYHDKSKATFESRFLKLGYKNQDLQNLYQYIEHKAPIAIHVNLQKYVQFFLEDTNYRNLFETNTGSGCTNKITRKNVQDKIFNNIFFDAQHHERVKYGAMNFTNDPTGIQCAKAYGKSYFLFKPHVRPRCTITFQDSFGCTESDFGTFRKCAHVLNRFSDAELHSAHKASLGNEQSSKVTGSYKQIQIHGSIEFGMDIDVLCIDSQELTSEQNLDNILSFIKLYGINYRVF